MNRTKKAMKYRQLELEDYLPMGSMEHEKNQVTEVVISMTVV